MSTPTDQRTPLSRERVLQAALTMADEGGVDSLSMRKIARELGFEVMSLYNHVANKDEILDGLVDLVAAEIVPAEPGADWQAALTASVVSAHAALLRHPWATALWSTQRTGSARLAFMEGLLRCLRDAGFAADLVYHGYHALIIHILGFARQEQNFMLQPGELAERAASFLKGFPVDDYPCLAEHMMQHIDPTHHDDDFEFVLGLILDGLARGGSR